MQQRRLIIATLILILAVIILIGATLIFVPQDTNPAFGAAIAFVNSAAKGDSATAETYMSDSLKATVADVCPDGDVSACIQSYGEPEWGAFGSAVYRRSIPDGRDAWDVQLIATYADGQGFSGVCIYTRVEKIDETWQVVGWAGFISCDLPDAGLSDLASDSAPNRVP